MTKYIMMALFYAGSVLIAYSLGYLTADKLDAATWRHFGAITPEYRRMCPPPPPLTYTDDEEAVE